MRTLMLALVIGAPAVASAEPRWSFGWRTAISNEMRPPPWLLAGGQWRYRPRPWLSFGLDFDGLRGAHHDNEDVLMTESARTIAKGGLSVAVHPWHGERFDTRGYVGAGAVWEIAHENLPIAGWVDAGSAYRPHGFVGIAVERLHPMLIRRGFGIGLDVRATILGGDGPASQAPALARFGVQAALELNAYLE